MLDVERLQNETSNYLAELQQAVIDHPDKTSDLDTLAEALLETGEAEKAYPLIQKSVSLDPEGAEGAQKFFWLGQILGGRHGIELFQRGLDSKTNCTTAQINEALLGMIEIWMTDLCMEPEAESECVNLINAALANTDRDAEAWSVLGSIRISQQNETEAKDALAKSWELFVDDFENSRLDYNVVPKLLRLAQSMLELQMADPVLEITGQLHRMDDQIAEVYYLNSLAHHILFDRSTTPLDRSKHIVAVRDAAEMVRNLDEEPDAEIVEAIDAIASGLPAPEIEDPYKDEDEAETETGFEMK